MPWRRWGIPDEVGCLAILLALSVGPVFLVAGFTAVKWMAVSDYNYYEREQREFQNYQPPVLPPPASTAVHFEIDVTGSGHVMLTPGGPCGSGSRCSYELPRGSQVTLAATPVSNAAFLGWEGDCSALGTAPIATLVAEARKRCLARFSPAGGPPAAGSTGPASAPASSSPTPRPTVTPAPTSTVRVPSATPLPTPTEAPRAGLRPEECSLESTLRSTDGSTVTSIEFTNNSRIPVRIYWLNYSGQRVLYKAMPTTAHYVQSTWVTHPWVVTDLEDRCLAIYMATSQPGSATLK